ncbi:MAG: hypothetical protein ABIF88_02765 [archaeon]
MKTLIVLTMIAVLAVAGFVVANTISSNNDSVILTEDTAVSSAPTCGGGCSAGNICGNPACGASVGKSCGCGR